MMIAIVLSIAMFAVSLFLVGRWMRRFRDQQASIETLKQVNGAVADLKVSLEAIRGKQDVFERQFLQPLLELQQVKSAVQTVSTLNMRLQQDMVSFEQRLQERFQESRERDQEERRLLEAIANVVARTVRKGRAGEDVIRETLRSLPPMYVVTNQPVKGGIVEFAIKVTDHRMMPLDSKWVASDLLEQYANETEDHRREELRRAIEERVIKHAKDVAKYLDSSVTTDLALCAVPDPAYELLTKAVTVAYQEGILIIPYSEVLPLVMVLRHLFHRYTGSIDLDELRGRLAQIRSTLADMQTVLENNLQKGSTMIQNAIDIYRQHLSVVRANLLAVERPEAERLAVELQEPVGGGSR